MRGTHLAALVALVATLALSGALPSPVTAGGPTGTCSGTWQKHSKRVVRYVRRHGKRKKVVRVIVSWTCTPPVTTTPDPPVVTPPTDPDPPPAPARLGVESKEWSYTLSRSHVASGDLIVELNNSGGDPHNLNVSVGDQASHGAPIQTIEAVTPNGGQGTARFTIAPGTYYLYCSLPTHEDQGMHATLVVDP